MLRGNLARLEEEMRKLAEQRVTSIVGDAPMLTDAQLGRVWNKRPYWVKKMREAGRVHSVPFGRREMSPRAVAILGLVKGI
jgi:hypothetical protein